MSLLTEASLLVTPNAYKATKLYSIIPTNGNGDFTVTRATTATRINSAGLMETVGNNVPRLDYSLGSCPNILVEPQRTNLVFPSATLTTQTITVTAVAHTLSFYGTGTVTLSGVATGTLVGTGVNNRVTLTFTPTAGSLILTVVGSVTMGQLETGAYATSYIPTTSTTVTRNLDQILRNNVYTNGLITASGGTWFVDIRNNIPVVRDLSTSGIFLNTGVLSTVGNGFVLRNPGSSLSRMGIFTVAGGLSANLHTIATDNAKVAFKWNGTTADIFVNGVKVVAATPFTPTTMENLIGEGSNRAIQVNSMALFPTPLTDTQCISLTT